MWAALLALAALQDPLATAEKLIAQSRFQQAAQILEGQPVSLRRCLLESKVHDGLNDPARAVERAEAALAIDPRSEAAHLQLGQIFLGRNTPQAAADVFSEALALHPQSFMLRLGRGLAWKDLERNEAAENDLKWCLARRPDFALAFDGLATVYLRTKRFEDLAALARAFRARNTTDYRGPYFAAAAGDGAEAGAPAVEALLRESIALNPNFAASRALLGKRRLNAGDTAGAIEQLETALKLRPDYSPAAFHLAQAYRKAGRLADAARALEQFRLIQQREQAPKPTLQYHRGK